MFSFVCIGTYLFLSIYIDACSPELNPTIEQSKPSGKKIRVY